jgi:hypothetical protein
MISFSLLRARHLKTSKRKKGTRKGKRGRELTIVIVFFHITTIVRESSQKLNKIGKTFSSRCGVYLAISRNDKSIKSFEQKFPLFLKFLLVLRCLAVVFAGVLVGDGHQTIYRVSIPINVGLP